MYVFKEFRKLFPDSYIDNIEQEYYKVLDAYYLGDETKIGIHSGRFSELVSSLLCNIEFQDTEDINQIKFSRNIHRLENYTKKDEKQEITCIVIPGVLNSIYTIRSKKRVAHFKLNIPKRIDMKYIKTSVDWVIAQLSILFLDINNEEIKELLEIFSYEDVKKVEKFEDGDIIFFSIKK